MKIFNMFSTGQIYFAIFFVIAFISTMIIVYRKDLRALKEEDTKYLKYLSLLNKEEIDNEYFFDLQI